MNYNYLSKEKHAKKHEIKNIFMNSERSISANQDPHAGFFGKWRTFTNISN